MVKRRRFRERSEPRERKEEIATARHRLAMRLRKLRAARGLSQLQAAEQAGLTPTHLWRLESGRWSPSFPSLVALARAYGVPLRDLF